MVATCAPWPERAGEGNVLAESHAHPDPEARRRPDQSRQPGKFDNDEDHLDLGRPTGVAPRSLARAHHRTLVGAGQRHFFIWS